MDKGLIEELLKRVGDLEARELHDENGREIKGALWIKRDEVIELIEHAGDPRVGVPKKGKP